MMNGPLPDIRAVIGADVPLHRVTKHELAGPCPQCGGTDRFRVNTQSQRWWCRQCSPSEHWSDAYEYVQRKSNITFPEAKAKLDGVALPPPPALKPPPPGSEPHGPIVKIYEYVDEAGALIFQVCRHDPKTFSQRRPATDKDIQRAKADKEFFVTYDADGSAWVGSLDGVYPALYRLPDLLARPHATVFLPEGERDADTVAGLGLLATTNAGGSTTWKPEHSTQLRGRHVVILPDKDAAGAKRTEKLTAALKDVAASVIVVTLPGDGKDVTDWVDAGGTAEQLKELVKAERTAIAVPPTAFPGMISAAQLGRMVFPPPRELVPGVLFEGATLLGAPPKSGKSINMLGLAVALATGGRAFGVLKVPKCRVAYLSLEDPLELVQDRLFTMMRSRQLPEMMDIVTACVPLKELPDQIELYVQQCPDVGLVIVDTLAHARGAVFSGNKNISQQDYQDLIGFSHLANRLHIAIVVVTHTAKALYEDELAQIAGTFGLSGAVDAIMLLGRKRFSPDATLAIFSRRLGREKKLELHWDEETLSYVLDGEMPAEQAVRTTSVVIVECLQDAPAPLHIRAIAELAGISYEVAKQRLFQLAKSGEVSKTEDGRYSVPKSGRNRRNFVTAPEENRVTQHSRPTPQRNHWADTEDDSGLGYETEGAEEPHNQDFKSDGYEVTPVTPAAKEPVPDACAACGFHGTAPAPWDATQTICAKCGVSTTPIEF